MPVQIFSQEESDDFTPGWAIGIKVSSLGLGLEIIKSFNKNFNLRLGGSYYKQNYAQWKYDDSDLAAFVYGQVGSISLIADWYFLKSVHLSGGVFYNMTVVKKESKLSESYYVGEIEVTPETVGSVFVSWFPNEICPYLGIGFGRTISRNEVVAFNFDLGALYQGSPKVAMEANGMVAPTANEDQRKLMENNVKGYQFYPFINFQLSFRFL